MSVGLTRCAKPHARQPLLTFSLTEEAFGCYEQLFEKCHPTLPRYRAAEHFL